MLKSPAMMEALKPLHHLEAEAAKVHTEALVDHQAALAEFKLHKSVKESILKEELKKKIAEKVVSLGGVSSLKDMIKDAQKEDPLGLGADAGHRARHGETRGHRSAPAWRAL